MYVSESEDDFAATAAPRHSSSDRLAAAVAHGGTAFAWFFAPLLVYLIKRDDSRWVEYQALQALLWSLFGTIVSLATCGLAIPIFLVFHLVAAYKVFIGEEYAYPIVSEIARGWVDTRR